MASGLEPRLEHVGSDNGCDVFDVACSMQPDNYPTIHILGARNEFFRIKESQQGHIIRMINLRQFCASHNRVLVDSLNLASLRQWASGLISVYCSRSSTKWEEMRRSIRSWPTTRDPV